MGDLILLDIVSSPVPNNLYEIGWNIVIFTPIFILLVFIIVVIAKKTINIIKSAKPNSGNEEKTLDDSGPAKTSVDRLEEQ